MSECDNDSRDSSALSFDHKPCLKFFLQEIGLVVHFIRTRNGFQHYMSLTLLSIRTMVEFFNNLFEHVEVKSCRESSMRFVRGSSSRYYLEVWR